VSPDPLSSTEVASTNELAVEEVAAAYVVHSGGAPVTIDRLFGLVNDGTTQSASKSAPLLRMRSIYGATPAAMAASR